MNQSSSLFLKLVIFLIAIIVLALLVYVFPQLILTDRTGMYRPILIGMYVPAIPFFIGLFQGLKLLNLIDKNNVFTSQSVQALKIIKYCAVAISALYAAGMPYIFYVAQLDDAPGVVAIGFVIVFASFVVGTAAALFQRLFQNAVDIKAENDLTV
jgi:hypothetical protein